MSVPPDDPPPLCPSAQPQMEQAVVLGVVGDQDGARRVAYLRDHLPATPEVVAMATPVSPTEVFRFAARCEGSACNHFDGTNCRLATRIVALLPPVSEALPQCRIRPECRWYLQEGRAACLRCPQVVTETHAPDDLYRRAAEGDPQPVA